MNLAPDSTPGRSRVGDKHQILLAAVLECQPHGCVGLVEDVGDDGLDRARIDRYMNPLGGRGLRDTPGVDRYAEVRLVRVGAFEAFRRVSVLVHVELLAADVWVGFDGARRTLLDGEVRW